MKIVLLLLRKRSLTENSVKRKLLPLSVSVMVLRIFFILSLLTDALYSFFFADCETYNFNIWRSTFLLTKGLLCSYDTQNNTRLLAVMELLFSRSTRYQEIITVYIILLDTLFVRCFHSWDSVLNTRREIPYQHAPMYYSLCGRVKKMAEFVLKPQCKIPEKLPYSTNFNACLWLDRSAIGFHSAPQSSTADNRKGCWWM